MAKSVLLEVITPSKLFYKDKVEMVIVRTLTGEEGFMAGHTWACKLLDVGVMLIREEGATDFKAAAISGGYIDVRDSFVIYTDSAEWAEDIDIDRALKEKTAAEEWLKSHNDTSTDPNHIDKAKISITKQITRMNLAANGARRKK
ncbi:ATP synthase F1 subunit epsilon [Aminipila sp.]|jgi:F-type H+-transporting ATPase subunit epsilon|uniref:ATP synthase F1 subunit epsilon n=1 Tax=Aminipila sp. TaxID=2060095 RepID=UPI001E0CEECB|nr:ATP synthase F1 subunit epsilon [Aminipila sp.]MBE6033522.1 ATP synthase F1 subunit epsilon [Clostridiales bacterium]